ncbi:hypothetical protein MMC25_006472 [Agyrium rufum]|nr:hypothetical protein [Agyrium rufum]
MAQPNNRPHASPSFNPSSYFSNQRNHNHAAPRSSHEFKSQLPTVTDLGARKPRQQQTFFSRFRRRWVILGGIISIVIPVLVLSLSLTLTRTHGQSGRVVTLSDGQYQGKHNRYRKRDFQSNARVELSNGKYEGVSLANGVTQWLGMRYAAAPVGDLRFAAPQNPEKHDGVKMANSYGPGCPGLGPYRNPKSTEDCLYVDVYAPSNANKKSKLPVYIFIPGGGFNGDNSHQNGSGLIIAADMNLITVMASYRGGPYGFLASTEVQQGGSLNNGLKDQRKLLEWVQSNIENFGGDPKHVTIGGASAGAGSVVYHLVAYGGKDFDLFHAAAAESQSFGAIRTIEESQYQYDGLVKRAKCSDSKDTLKCLRSLDFATLQNANLNQPFPGAPGNPIFPYNPTLDFDFVTDYPLNSFDAGKFIRVPTIWGDDTNEGTIFTPRSISNATSAGDFLTNQFPKFNNTILAKYGTLYDWDAPASSSYWKRASSAYGETRYVCPGIHLSDAYVNNQDSKVWNYRYNVEDPNQLKQGLGVPHTTEVAAIWGPGYVPTPSSYRTTNKNIVPVIQGYWTSFMRVYDPNTLRAKGTPTWDEWVKGKNNRLLFTANDTAMETVDKAQLERCDYIKGIALDIAQ